MTLDPWTSSPVILLGLTAAMAWGTADFAGGLTSRRAALFGVVLVSQLVGVTIAFAVTLARGESMPAPEDVAWSVIAAGLGVTGVLALYRGLAVGRMGVVAPVTAVLAACVPVAAGFVLEEVPGPSVLAGIALAIAAVALVSRAPGTVAQRSGIEFAVAAGIGFGLFNVAISRVSEGSVFAPLTIMRGAQAAMILVVILATRRAWRLDSRILPAVVAIGILDIAGNAFFVMAAQAGPLAVAAVLSSMYPVMTIVLATVILRERFGALHAIGVASALAAIILIGSGSG